MPSAVRVTIKGIQEPHTDAAAAAPVMTMEVLSRHQFEVLGSAKVQGKCILTLLRSSRVGQAFACLCARESVGAGAAGGVIRCTSTSSSRERCRGRVNISTSKLYTHLSVCTWL